MKRGPARVRLADVAEAAGVGLSITSRVLNGDPTASLRPETRDRILRAAAELNYRPSAFGRGLRLSRTMTLGMVIPGLPYQAVNAEIIRAAEREAGAAGYVMVLADAEEFLPTGDAYRRLLLEGRVDGLLIANVAVSRESLATIKGSKLPFVLVNRRVPRVKPCVTMNEALATEVAVSHLVDLGHRHIGLIGGPTENYVAQERLAAFRHTLWKAGIRTDPDWIVESSLDERTGAAAMDTLLARDRRPTAIVVWTLGAAVGALHAARTADVSVPDDLSLITFHDAPVAAYLDPPLTTVRLPLEELGATSVECLIKLIGGERIDNTVVQTAPMLVERESTRALHVAVSR